MNIKEAKTLSKQNSTEFEDSRKSAALNRNKYSLA